MSDIARSAWCWRRFTEAALTVWPGWRRAGPWRSATRPWSGTRRPPRTIWPGSSHLTAGRGELRAAMAGRGLDSVGRWRATLSGQDVAEMEAEIGPLLTRLGYA